MSFLVRAFLYFLYFCHIVHPKSIMSGVILQCRKINSIWWQVLKKENETRTWTRVKNSRVSLMIRVIKTKITFRMTKNIILIVIIIYHITWRDIIMNSVYKRWLILNIRWGKEQIKVYEESRIDCFYFHLEKRKTDLCHWTLGQILGKLFLSEITIMFHFYNHVIFDSILSTRIRYY